jgi:tetratricopeptide (TPR) repeat protein
MKHKEETLPNNDGMPSDSEEIAPLSSTTLNTSVSLAELTALQVEIEPLLDRPSAIDQLSQALAKYPDQSQWYSCRGLANIKLENFDQAIQDLTAAIELTLSIDKESVENYNETLCTSILNRAKARENLGDLEGAVGDAKLALDHANTPRLETDCKNASAVYAKKLKKQIEMASSGPVIVHHGSGVVIKDITEEDAKVSAKKAGVIAAVRMAKGLQQADVGKEFRAQFIQQLIGEEKRLSEGNTKAKKKNKNKKKKKKKQQGEVLTETAAADEAISFSPSSSGGPEGSGMNTDEEYKKLYKVETFTDPHDATITIERIQIPITYIFDYGA